MEDNILIFSEKLSGLLSQNVTIIHTAQILAKEFVNLYQEEVKSGKIDLFKLVIDVGKLPKQMKHSMDYFGNSINLI